jgi:hypothetical protein
MTSTGIMGLFKAGWTTIKASIFEKRNATAVASIPLFSALKL